MAEPNFKSNTLWTGDNLSIMRGINSDCIDLIYIDPPFNSNRNYAAPVGSKAAGAAFKDAWTLSDIDLYEHGELAERHPAVYTVIEAAGLAHGKSMKSYLVFMSIRILEMYRILKPTGSFYLHCDDTAGHYLKLILDCVFGSKFCKNTIIWKRNSGNNAGNNFGRIADWILRCVKSDDFTWNQQYQEMSSIERKAYRHTEEDTGRIYKTDNLTAPKGAHNVFTWRGTTPGSNRGWARSYEGLEELYAQGKVILKADGTPSTVGLKRYLDEHPGAKVQNIWTDIQRVGNTSKERIGYPTQKPLALLNRIIETSSNPGDMVLDVFCGCATTLVSAQNLGRQWAGIDLSEKAIEIARERLKECE